MARLFNGTSDTASVAIDLSSYSIVSLSFWMWWDSYANNDHMAMEYGTPSAGSVSGFYIDPNSAFTAGRFTVYFGDTVHSYQKDYVRPTAAAWHHYTIAMDRGATDSIALYVDGILLTATNTSAGGVTGNFANSTLFFMNRNNASLFGPGRQCDQAIWGGVALGQSDATALAAGAPPESVHPTGLIFNSRMLGKSSPEPDQIGGLTVTLSGTTQTADPPLLIGGQECWINATVSPATGTMDFTPTVGNTLIATVALPSSADSVTSITQTGVTWSKLGQSNSQNDCEIWAGIVGTGPSTSITIVTNLGAIAAVVKEYVGYSANQSATAVLNSGALSTTPTTGSITSVGTNLVIGAVAVTGNSTTTAGPTNNFAVGGAANSTTATVVAAGYQVETAGGSVSTGYTVGTLAPFDAVIVSLSKLDSFTVALAGTATLTATVKEFHNFTATLAGTSSLTATFRELQRFTLALAGTSTLGATVTPYQRVTLTLAGTSSLTATITEYHRFTATIAGTSALSATLTELLRFSVVLAGTSSLSATVTPYQRIALTLAGTSGLAATLTEYQRLTLALAGTSSLGATVTPLQLFTLTLAGTSGLLATLTPLQLITAALAGTSSLSATVTQYLGITTTLAGTSTLSATLTPLQRITATLAGTSTLTATLTEYLRFTTNLDGTSSLTATVTRYHRFTATLAGTSALTATLTRYQRFSLTVAGTSTFLPAMAKHLGIFATIAGTSTLFAALGGMGTPGHGYISDFNPNGVGGTVLDRATSGGYIRDKRGDE